MSDSSGAVTISTVEQESRRGPAVTNFQRKQITGLGPGQVRSDVLIGVRMIENCPIIDEIRIRLVQGDSPRELLKFVRIRKVLRKKSDSQIERALSAYRKYRLGSKRLSDAFGTSLRVRMREAEMAIDELQEYENLYTIQKDRIDGFRKQEKDLPIPLTHIDDSIEVGISILKASSELKMDLGLNRRAPDEVNMAVEARSVQLVEARYGRESLTRVMADPAKRSKVQAVFEKLLTNSMLQQAVLDKVKGPVVVDTTGEATEIQTKTDDEE